MASNYTVSDYVITFSLGSFSSYTFDVPVDLMTDGEVGALALALQAPSQANRVSVVKRIRDIADLQLDLEAVPPVFE